MNSWIVSQVADLLSGSITVVKDVHAYTGNAKAITWKVKVMNGTEAANLSNAKCSVYVIREDQATVVVEGTISGNLCEAVFKKECFAVPGVVKCLMNLTDSSETEFTVSAFEFVNGNGPTDKLVDPGEVLDINAAIIAAKGAIRFDVEQNLTEAQKETARKNIDVGVGYAKQEDVDAIINAAPQYASAEGNPITLEAFAGQMLDVVTVLEPKQAGSGDPYPAGGGRNLWPNGDINGVGSKTYRTELPAGTYVISGVYQSADVDNTQSRILVGFANGEQEGFFVNRNERFAKVINAESDITVFNFYASSNSSASQDDEFSVINVQLELGSTATEWQPWENIRPITGYDKLSLAAVGMNLAPTHEDVASNAGLTYSASDGKITISGTTTKNVRLDTPNLILPPGQYTLAPNNSATANAALYMRKPDGTQFGSISLEKSTTAKHTFTLTEPTEACVSLYINSGVTLDVTIAVMLNVGPVKSFEPYRGTIQTVQIGQTVYGGKFDWLTGKLVAEYGFKAFDGTEEWYAYSANYPHLFVLKATELGALIDNKTIPVHCSHYPYDGGSLTGGETGCRFNASDSYIVADKFYVSDGRYTDVAEFKSYLAAQKAAGTPVQVAYKLATPIEIQLSSTEIRTLSGVNTLYGDGNLSVTYRTDISGVFDPDNDGLVDYAANAGKLGGQLPSFYAPANHCLIEKKGKPVTANLKAGRGITAVTTITPKQAGSGDPYPAGCGRNLLPNNATSQTKAGITFTVNPDGSVHVKGTATENVTVSIAGSSTNYNYMLPAGEYIISGCAGGAKDTYFMKLRSEALNPVAITMNGEQRFTHDGSPTWFYIYVYNGVAVDETLYPMIRLASDTNSTYAPYSNIRPITGYDKLSLVAAGKNLCPKVKAYESQGITLTVADDGEITLNGTAAAAVNFNTDINPPIPPGTYALTANNSAATSNSSSYIVIRDAAGNNILDRNFSKADGGATIKTTTVEGTIFRIRVAAGETITNFKLRPQLEVGNKGSSFVAPDITAYTVQIGQTVYGGRYDWLNGKLIVDLALRTFDGSENWKTSTTNTSGKSRFTATNLDLGILPPPNTSTVAEGLVCSHYKAAPSTTGGTYQCVQSVGVYTSGSLYFYDDRYAEGTAEEWGAYLSAQHAAGTPVQIAYKLKNPIEIDDLSAAGVIEALEGVNTVYGDGDLEVTFNHDRLLTLMWNKLMANT